MCRQELMTRVFHRTFFWVYMLACVFGFVFGFWQYSQTLSDWQKGSTPKSSMIFSGLAEGNIPAIDEPRFESVFDADQYLHNDGYGILLTSEQETRFYPFQILVWHELVDDTWIGKPILVQYCPLCFSGHVFDRRLKGETLSFQVSDQRQEYTTMIKDTSGSLWNPNTGQCVSGKNKDGELYPLVSQIVLWSQVKNVYPSARVLSRKTGFVRDYTHDPYGDYLSDRNLYIVSDHKDSRLPAKEMVFGVSVDGVYKAYPKQRLQQIKTITDTIGTNTITLEWNEALQTAKLITQPGTITQTFWFHWANLYPSTQLYP